MTQVATRLDGCRLRVPSHVTLSSLRQTTGYALPGLGRLEDFALIDEHTVEFAVIGTTEAGEALIRAMRQGKCRMEAKVPQYTLPGMSMRDLRIVMVWEDPDQTQAIVEQAIREASPASVTLPRKTIRDHSSPDTE